MDGSSVANSFEVKEGVRLLRGLGGRHAFDSRRL